MPAGGRLGILGGSFNPPHRGHVELARHALRELGLERVLLMPARISPGKPVEEEPNPAHPEHRLEMCRLAAVGVEGVEACALEIEREGPSYTVDTLRALHDEHPDTELTFILGADVASTLPTWHEAAAAARARQLCGRAADGRASDHRARPRWLSDHSPAHADDRRLLLAGARACAPRPARRGAGGAGRWPPTSPSTASTMEPRESRCWRR